MDRNPRAASEAISAVLLYATVYLFMNLGAFAIVAFLRNSIHSEEIKDYAGLIRQCPSAAVAMTIILFSLVGLPPLAGFWPKLRVLQSLYEAGGPLLMFVFVVAAINTAIALVYYVRVAKTICMDPEPESSQPAELSFLPSAFVWAMALPLVVFGIVPELIAPLAQQATNGLFS
jgi:NADH-quinone oxidoreductase subunit N